MKTSDTKAKMKDDRRKEEQDQSSDDGDSRPVKEMSRTRDRMLKSSLAHNGSIVTAEAMFQSLVGPLHQALVTARLQNITSAVTI